MSARFYDFKSVGTSCPEVDSVIATLNESYVSDVMALDLLRALAHSGCIFTVECSGDYDITVSSFDLCDEDPDADSVSWLHQIWDAARKREILELLDRAYAALNKKEYVHVHGDVTVKHLPVTDDDAEEARTLISKAYKALSK